MPLCSKIWAKLPWYFIVLPCNIKSGWPSGLRRCVQVAVHFCGRGFESHFWQIFFLDKTDLTIGNDTFFLNQYTDSRVAQWKRAGPITQRSVDRNYALLTFLFLFLFFSDTENRDWSIFPGLFNSVRMAEWSKAPDSRYTALLPW